MPNKKKITDSGKYPIFSGYRITGYYDEYNLEKDEIVIVARGVGGTGDVKLSSQKCYLTNLSIAVEMNEEIVIKKYLYYYFQIRNLRYLDSGSAQSQITISDLEKVKISVPTVNIQKRIVKVLEKIDDKIELNTSINENLEQQAQAIFKSWFVDFEPFGGVIPMDWQQGNLLDIADYLNGLAMQKFRPKEGEIGLPVLKIKELRQGICDLNSELCSPSINKDYIIQDGDVIFSWSGSLLVDFWCGGICGLNQHLFKVTSSKYDKWFYYSWTKYHLNRFVAIAADMATTMGHIKREELAKSIVFIPNQGYYNEISAQLKPIYDLIIANRIENQRLSSLRDTILPKLMSGEIDVSNMRT